MSDLPSSDSQESVPLFDIFVVSDDPDTQVQAMSEMMRPAADFAGLGWSGSEGLEIVRMWLLDGVILTEMKMRAHVMLRRPIHLRKYPHDTVMVRHHLSGQTSNEIGIDAYHAKPGDVHITDLTELWSGVATDVHFYGAALAHATIGYDPARHPAHVPVVPPQSYDCEIADTFRYLITDAVYGELEQANTAAGRFIDLLRNYLDGVEAAPVEPYPKDLRKLQMRAFLEKSLSNPDLSTELVAEAFGLSRASVYRELSALGGFDRYVQRRRLEEACKELAFGDNTRGVIGEVAQRWQFSSVQHFSREFKRHFGVPPSQAVATWLFKLTRDDPHEMGKVTARGVPPWYAAI
ncbi:MAG: helix-turn-helix domain-containing protein [Pseudomonadota bacterium]